MYIKIMCSTALILACLDTAQAQVTPEEAARIGVEAYIYGYPLATVDMTRRVMTNVASPEALRGPMGAFLNARAYPTAAFRDVTAPNADTLYSSAWLDLASGKITSGSDRTESIPSDRLARTLQVTTFLHRPNGTVIAVIRDEAHDNAFELVEIPPYPSEDE